MFSLEGKTAIVTGGASGFGLSTVKRFAKAGATVVIADITDSSDLATEVGGLYVKTDVTNEDQMKALMDKAAVIGVTKTAALEFADRNIRVNCICPGTFDTPMAHEEDFETEMAIAPLMMPLGRLGRPEEVAALHHFLAADDCAFISGQAICIDGGMTAGLSMGIITKLMENM